MNDIASSPAENAQFFFWNAATCAVLADRAANSSHYDPAVSAAPPRLEASVDYVRMLLIAQGLEFASKAWFLHRGESIADLKRRAFGHDLVSQFQRAAREGFPQLGHAEMWLLALLNGALRDDKELQYAKPKPTQWPSSLAVRELLHECLQTLCSALYPAVNLEKVATARDPGRWAGLRADAFGAYNGISLSIMRTSTMQAAETPALESQ